MVDHIDIGEEHAEMLIQTAVVEFVHTGDPGGLKIAGMLVNDKGEPPPLDEIVSFYLVESGRLLTA